MTPILPPSTFSVPPDHFDMSAVDGAAAAFARRSEALRLSDLCQLRMNNSARSFSRRNHLPAY